ncbi:MAG: hypothetical protein AB7I41_06025 [Candidatus Sericytochromatia bacterium]
MGELHLNKQVFDTLKRSTQKDQRIDAKEAKELQAAILADGQIDGAEKALLAKLAESDPTSSRLTLKTEGGQSMTFDPQTLAFGKGAKTVLAQTLTSLPDGANPADYEKILNQTQSPLEARLAALEGLGQLAHAGDATALNGMADYYAKSTQLEEKRSIRNLLMAVAERGSEPLKALARMRYQQLGATAPLKPVAPAVASTGEAARQEITSKLKALLVLEQKPDQYSSYQETLDALKNPEKQRELLSKTLTPEFREKLLKYASPHQKGQFARLALEAYQEVPNIAMMRQGYQNVNKQLGPQLILDLFKSAQNQDDWNQLEKSLRGTKNQAVDYKKLFSTAQFAGFNQHRTDLNQGAEKAASDTALAIKKGPQTKGWGLHLTLKKYAEGKLSPEKAKQAAIHIFRSFDNKADYDHALKALREYEPVFEEGHLQELLGADFEALKADIGVIRPEKQSPTLRYLNAANAFFARLGDRQRYPLGADDYLSTRDLTTERGKQLLQDMQETGFSLPTDLDSRLQLAQFIADGRIDVSGVPGYFADKYLFGKNQLGLFEIAGDYQLKDFLSGSVQQKAAQFVGVEKFSQMVYQTTQDKIWARQTQLRKDAADPNLGATLKGLQAAVKPYQNALAVISANQGKKGFLADMHDKALADLKAQLKAQAGGLLSPAEQQTRVDALLGAYQMLKEYGSDGPEAAKRMTQQAKALDGVARELGVAGNYEGDRLAFRKKAFALYHNKDMDLLRADYAEGLKKLGPAAQAVVAKAESLEAEVALAKSAVKFGAGMVAKGLGVGWAMEALEWGHKLGNTYLLGDMVDGIRRSEAAQRQAVNGLVVDAAALAISKGIDHAKAQVNKEIEAAVDKDFPELVGIDRGLLSKSKLSDTELKGLFKPNSPYSQLKQADLLTLLKSRDDAIKNLKDLASQKWGVVQVLVNGGQAFAKGGEGTQVLADILVKGGHRIALMQMTATERQRLLLGLGENVVGAKLLDKAQSTLISTSSAALKTALDRPLLPAEMRKASQLVSALQAQVPGLTSQPPKTMAEFVAILERALLFQPSA